MYMHTGIYISPQLVHARLSNGVTTFLPWKLLRTYLESCVTTYRLRNPIKSTLSHDAVAAVVLYKHHLIIRVGAILIQFVYGSHSRLAADLTLDKNLFSLLFSWTFHVYLYMFIYIYMYSVKYAGSFGIVTLDPILVTVSTPCAKFTIHAHVQYQRSLALAR